jgi:hypothetical protein
MIDVLRNYGRPDGNLSVIRSVSVVFLLLARLVREATNFKRKLFLNKILCAVDRDDGGRPNSFELLQ